MADTLTKPHCRSLEASSICAHCGLRPLSVCAALEVDELRQLESVAHVHCLAAKATLFAQDEPAQYVYNITAGVVRLYKLLPDGRRQIVGFALPGDFLGLALADRYGFSADAIEPVTACRFSREAFTGLVDHKPRLLRRLHEFATHELSLAHDQMVILGRRNAAERIGSFLIALRDRWGRLNGHTSVHVPLPMSRQDIADFLGLTIETVSRTLNKLAREKTIVIVPDGIRILNVTRIEALSEL
jgi:CRP/FNR family transcriptional regulator